MYQKILFDPEDIFRQPLKKYELFYSLLDLYCLESPRYVGRKPISRAALTRVLIFKNLRSLKTLSDLAIELYEQPDLSLILGFGPRAKPVPVERPPLT